MIYIYITCNIYIYIYYGLFTYYCVRLYVSLFLIVDIHTCNLLLLDCES